MLLALLLKKCSIVKINILALFKDYIIKLEIKTLLVKSFDRDYLLLAETYLIEIIFSFKIILLIKVLK